MRASFLEVNELLGGLQRVVELGKTRDQVNGTYTSAGKQLEKIHRQTKIAELEEQNADDAEEKAAARQVLARNSSSLLVVTLLSAEARGHSRSAGNCPESV